MHIIPQHVGIWSDALIAISAEFRSAGFYLGFWVKTHTLTSFVRVKDQAATTSGF